ncbi:DNA damage-inducible protein 1 [Lunasporangiospora selenospora]|uniref:DNA damage-inducible protein 1 n=1 Tax=Lunasporangiospora selenospora TaxID=979761 RepID=A0A9P6KGT5_9FUNG|nr:DNA damage-inducible protein 1 [Lunasporangiospora selenospora]
MRVSILTENGDIYPLEFDSQIELENIKALLEDDFKIPVDEQMIFHNSVELIDPKSTLQGNNVVQDDILALRRRLRQVPFAQTQQMQAFNRAHPRSGPEVHPGQISQSPADPHNAEQIRQHRQPELAEAAVNNPSQFHTMIRELDEQRRRAEATRVREIEALNAKPYFDVEAQARIEEAIRLENVAANLEAALEYNPESFGRVTMLYIEVEVNGHPVKAFVDSGAQATIMSPECAESCGIMRLVDRRFAGVARGVGVARILGRVHSAQIRVGSELFLSCSFTIMEGKGVDLLFGLDMLKRHQAQIDLAKDCLVINDTEIRFLSEYELPASARITGELTPEEIASIGGTVPTNSSNNTSQSVGGSEIRSTAPIAAPSTAFRPVAAQPPPVSSIMGPLSQLSVESGPASQTSTARSEAMNSGTTRSDISPQHPAAASAQSSKYPESSIQTLISMGANRAEAIVALDAAEGNVNIAVNFLF